jgi:uncharacterized protein YjbJ (UPF0337 family)
LFSLSPNANRVPRPGSATVRETNLAGAAARGTLCAFSNIRQVIPKGASTMAGLGDKIEGKAKEVKGAATGDKKTELEGKAQGAKGDVKDAVDKA